MRRFPSGTTDQVIYFVAVDSTDLKTRETGLTTFTVYRSRNGAAATAFTTPTVAEVSAANMPGVYSLLLDEDMTIDAGNKSEEVVLHITQASMAPVTVVYELYRPDVTDGETLTVAGGIAQANVAQFGGTAGTFSSGRPEVNASHAGGIAWASGAIIRDSIGGDTGLRSVRSSTCQAGSTSTTIVLDASASATDNVYNGQSIQIRTGTGLDQSRVIIAYNGTTKVATITPAWATTPDNTSVYTIQRWGDASVSFMHPSTITEPALAANSGMKPVRLATAQAGNTTTVTLDASASATNDIYVGQNITIVSGAGVGQTRLIYDYIGSSKLAIITPTFRSAAPPDNTSVFAILPSGPTNVARMENDTIRIPVFTQDTGLQAVGVGDDVVAANSSTVTLASSESAVDDYYNGMSLVLTGTGPGAGQVRIITDYDGTTKVATISPNWVTTPDTTTDYAITNFGPASVSLMQPIPEAALVDAVWDEPKTAHNTADTMGQQVRGAADEAYWNGFHRITVDTAQAGTSTTITLATGASAVDDFYNGTKAQIYLGTGISQVREIIDYDGTTKVATIAPSWSVNPDATSAYILWNEAAVDGGQIDGVPFAGEFPEDHTSVVVMFQTLNQTGILVATSSTLESADIRIFKDGNSTQKTTTNGITVASTFDGKNGVHCVVIDTSNDTGDVGFWTAGSTYTVMTDMTETTNNLERNKVVAQFRLTVKDASIAAIKTKTDNLPTDPADASVIAGRFDTIDTSVADLPTNAELTTALSDLPTNSELTTALADLPTNAELATALDALPTASENALAMLAAAYEGSETFKDFLRLARAVLLGEASGLDTTTATFRDAADTKDRVTATVTVDGNRTAVTLDPT